MDWLTTQDNDLGWWMYDEYIWIWWATIADVYACDDSRVSRTYLFPGNRPSFFFSSRLARLPTSDRVSLINFYYLHSIIYFLYAQILYAKNYITKMYDLK